MKVIFFGSSDFSVPFLYALCSSKHKVMLVVTGVERSRGRGRKITPNPVKVIAKESGIDFLEADIIDTKIINRIIKTDFDYIVLVSFGKILPEELINKAGNKTINVHPSLLPRYRGPSPIESALLNGDIKTGISLIRISKKLDEGDIYIQEAVDIKEEDNKDALEKRIIEKGSSMLISLLDLLDKKIVEVYPQSKEGVSYTRTFNKDDLHLDWGKPAEKIFNKVRAFSSYPGCFSYWKDKNIKILKASKQIDIERGLDMDVASGTVVLSGRSGLLVRCGDARLLSILNLKPPNRSNMSYKDFINGYRIKPGDIFE